VKSSGNCLQRDAAGYAERRLMALELRPKERLLLVTATTVAAAINGSRSIILAT
jgi:hypothetical protein